MFPAQVDGEGYPLLLARRGFLSPSMPSMEASAKSIAYGDVSRFLIRRVRGGLTLKVFPERYAEFLQSGFEAYLRIQSALAKPANAAAPIQLLQMHS